MKIQTGKSIATRLVLVVLGLYSLVALGVTGSHVFLEYRYQKTNIIKDLSDIRGAFKNAVADSLWKMDQQALRTVVAGVLRIPSVIGVRISNPDGELIAIGGMVQAGEGVVDREARVNLLGLGTERVSAGAEEFGLRLFEHSFPLELEAPASGFYLGKMTIYSSSSVIYRRMKLELLLLAFNVIFTFVTFCIALQWAVRRYLGRPLGELAQATEVVSLENLDSFCASIAAPDGCELKVFEDSFNTMVRNLDLALGMRREAENELKLSQKRLQAILEASPDPVVVYDDAGCVTFLNPAFTRLFGWSSEELLGRRIPFVPEDQRNITEATIETLLKSGGTTTLETKRFTKEGRLLDVLANAAVINDGQGHSNGIVVNLTDLSNIRKMETQLLHAQKMESVGRLAGGVAHDFNNMLGVILGNTEMVLDQVDQRQPFHANLREIMKAAQRSSGVTRQLLAFARKQTIAPKALDLNKTVASMLNMLRRLIGEDIDLAWLPAPNPCPVRMDPSQIDQILANLCVNARDAIHDVGKITIETGAAAFDDAYCADHPGFVPGNFVLLAVSDDGCGMDRDTLDNLFEPFYTTKDVDKGTGLGLATVYGIIKQNDGFINVYSEPNRGTTFRIYLHRHETADEHAPITGVAQSEKTGSETILLVEDEPAILRMTAMMLERLGYTVLSAATPGDAIRLAREHGGHIHLLMTDVVMPEMNGRDLARHLQSTFLNLKRLYMSGYTANVIAHHGVLDEGVNFIQKPFSKQDLSAKVREVLDAPGG